MYPSLLLSILNMKIGILFQIVTAVTLCENSIISELRLYILLLIILNEEVRYLFARF